MKVIIDQNVHSQLNEFYENALRLHLSLDKITISKKMERLYDGLNQLSLYAPIYGKARLHPLWMQKGYRECIIEDIHFAFQIYTDDETGEAYVYVHEACHSFLYHE